MSTQERFAERVHEEREVHGGRDTYEEREKRIACAIAKLVRYARMHLYLGQEDEAWAVNQLLDVLSVKEPYNGELRDGDWLESAQVFAILQPLMDDLRAKGILTEGTVTEQDHLESRLMGLLMPRPSEWNRMFFTMAAEQSPVAATDAFYALSIASHYIRMDRIALNEQWVTHTDYGLLQITINRSKPEKDPKEIALERALPKSSYPSCVLCKEAVGYAGTSRYPARFNHRIVPLTLRGKGWYMQYSPYVYYNEHCIVLSESHAPMRISRATFADLLDFVEQYPHYFIGSNADLPIVGGSILAHEHYQGGRHTFPMLEAPALMHYAHSDYVGVEISVLQWPMSVVRLRGMEKHALEAFADEILCKWQQYSDERVEIVACTERDGERIPHQTITPIARRLPDERFELNLVLRNNRTNEEHPQGIFHPHKELHHIKKENIGLIEVMGLAVLPGRLHEELLAIEQVLSATSSVSVESPVSAESTVSEVSTVSVESTTELRGQTEDYEAKQQDHKPMQWDSDESHMLYKHRHWIRQLQQAYTTMESDNWGDCLRQEVGMRFRQVLLDAGVFKQTEDGLAAFERWMHALGARRV